MLSHTQQGSKSKKKNLKRIASNKLKELYGMKIKLLNSKQKSNVPSMRQKKTSSVNTIILLNSSRTLKKKKVFRKL